MLCKSKNSITVRRKNQFPKVLQELNVDAAIREAPNLHQDKE